MPQSVQVRRAAAQRARVRSQLSGVRSTRKLIRQIPDAAKAEFVEILKRVEPKLLAAVKADTPVLAKSRRDRVIGQLKASITSKLLKQSLRLRVGLLTKQLNKDLFYGHILEYGRKADTKSRGGPITPRRFVNRLRPAIRGELRRELNSLWDKTLIDAAVGVGDD